MRKLTLVCLVAGLTLMRGLTSAAFAGDPAQGFAFGDKVVLTCAKGREYLGPFRSLEEYTLVDIEDCQLADFMKTMRGHIDEYNRTQGVQNGKPAQHHATISPGYDETRNPGRKTKSGYDLALGIVFTFFPGHAFQMLDISDKRPQFDGYVALLGAFVFVIGIGHWNTHLGQGRVNACAKKLTDTRMS